MAFALAADLRRQHRYTERQEGDLHYHIMGLMVACRDLITTATCERINSAVDGAIGHDVFAPYGDATVLGTPLTKARVMALEEAVKAFVHLDHPLRPARDSSRSGGLIWEAPSGKGCHFCRALAALGSLP